MDSARPNLATESDVEQMLLFPLLTKMQPEGLGFPSHEVRTKPDIRSLKIGKGKEEKLYFPDYVVLVSGLPVLIVEAKAPGAGVEDGFREARLYAAELNSKYPTKVNPARIVICSDGDSLVAGFWDASQPEVALSRDEMGVTDPGFSRLVEMASRAELVDLASKISSEMVPEKSFRPVEFVGGNAIENEEIGVNWLGTQLATNYRTIFNPTSRDERNYIAEHGYVTSNRRERFVDPINRVLRGAMPAPTVGLPLDDTGNPTELYRTLRRGKDLEQQVLLIVGGPGVGKSTFIDYVREVKLPVDVRDKTVWVHVNMNSAPVNQDEIYQWLRTQMISELQRLHAEIDFEDIDIIKRLYAPQIQRLRKGALALLDEESTGYRERLADEVLKLQRDLEETLNSYVRYLCADRGKLLVLVLDNCDKRSRDEQLLMFQVAQWAQNTLRCLILLPLRRETYDNNRAEPPLDTALKDLVYRIEAPAFHKVLEARLRLVYDAMLSQPGDSTLTYTLPNSIRVRVTRDEQRKYLEAMLKSLLLRDQFFRSVIVGLAGHNIRRALEIFLEICTSGYISDEDTLRIRQSEGEQTLSFNTVCHALLRHNRRFYRGESSLFLNLFQREPDDPPAAHFVRPAILRWLSERQSHRGSAHVRGYFSVSEVKAAIVPLGVGDDIVRRELLRLLESDCIIAEHLRKDSLEDRDLVRIGSAGEIHLRFLGVLEYLAATSEDTWLAHEARAHRIADRLGGEEQFQLATQIRNAEDMLNYLAPIAAEVSETAATFIQGTEVGSLVDLSDEIATVQEFIGRESRQNPWFTVLDRYTVGDVVTGRVRNNHRDHGVFVEIEHGIDGLIPRSLFSETGFEEGLGYDQPVKVRIEDIRDLKQRMTLRVILDQIPVQDTAALV